MRSYINTFEYHTNIFVHREVCAIESAVNYMPICFPRDSPGIKQQRKQYAGISGTSIRTYSSET
jgi:hypothetical protein